ncbi:MAG: hypothetical protein ACXAC7_01555 [Candidatus Hodarchaeales archaeon]|jgi:hypothetical protein
MIEVSNNLVYNELEVLNEQALQLLHENNHSEVVKYLTFLFNNVCDLKEKIAYALIPQEENYEMISEINLEELILVQGFYNLFLNKLLEAITEYVCELYNQACEKLAFDLNLGAIASNTARKTVRFYEVHLEKLKAPEDSYKGQMYFSMKEMYRVVYKMGEDTLTKITQRIIHFENVLVQKALNHNS